MTTDKNIPSEPAQTGQPQNTSGETHINPFRDADAKEPELTVEEETELEQQRKEALTERD